MKTHWLVASIFVLIAIFLALLAPDIAKPVAAQSPGVHGPFVGPPVIPMSFDGDVRRLPLAQVAQRETPRFRLSRPAQVTPPISADPVRQTRSGSVRMPAPLQNFKGLDRPTWSTSFPPDPNGDVGPNHYIETVNIAIGIFSKTGTQLWAFTYNTFFSGAPGPCGSNGNRGDVIVLYDATVNRWIISDFAWLDIDTGPYYECIAVSKSDDPVSGGWWLYALQADANYLNDYPKLGVWRDGIYMAANLFDAYGGGTGYTWQGVKVWALNRDELINGLPLNPVSFLLSPALGYINLLPSNFRGSPPPAGTPNLFGSIESPNKFFIWKFHVDWNTPTNSTFTGPTNVTVANFAMPCNAAWDINCVPQLNGESVDGLGDRLMMQLQYRNISGVESLWVNHTVANSTAVGDPTGVRWYEIRDPNGTPTVYQQGTYQPDSNYRWMGSLAVDRFGDMALGYSVSSASMYPAIRYAGRLEDDPPGTLPQGETSLTEGTGSQSGGYNRWGDYSAMSVDPNDDCTFWYVNQYYETTGGNWQTRIGSFKFPVCKSRYFFPLIFK
jgi:hypothetical protein